MSRVLVLFTRESIESKQAHPLQLQHLLQNTAGAALDIETATYDDLSYILRRDDTEVYVHTTGRRLSEYDFVYLRRIKEGIAQAIAVGKYCDAAGIPCIDTEIGARPGSMGKLTQYLQFALAGLPFPDTVYSSSHDLLLQAFKQSGIEFPIILKAVSGSRGSDNHLIRTRGELVQQLQAAPNVHFLIQKYIPNNSDYRVWVLGNTIGPILHRSRSAGHLNNTSQGGDAVLVESTDPLPQTVLTECIRAARLLHRDVAGVDVVFENDRLDGAFYFFEVNRAPQIEGTPYETEKAAALVSYMKARIDASERGK